MPDRISAFVEAVGAEIRWKKARPLLTEEIRTHLLDQRDACMAQGMDEDTAQAEAVRQMGDPVALGADLDRVHRPRPQWGLLALALVLWKQRGKRWRGAAVCLGWTALAAAGCCLCPSVYALVQVTMAGLVLVGAFLAFFLWLLWKTIHLRQTLGRAVCLAALTTLAVQMAASLSLTLGVPVLPGGFPLVVGNTNTVVDMLLIGLALSALRDGGLPETAPALCQSRNTGFHRVCWENGELIFSLRPRQG